jgi:Fe-S cluster biogenesis protein NfuA
MLPFPTYSIHTIISIKVHLYRCCENLARGNPECYLPHTVVDSKEATFLTLAPRIGTLNRIEERAMLFEEVKSAIENVRPSLKADGGDIELVSVSQDGVVKVRLTGACGSCPYSLMTLKQGVESYLKKVVPQIKEVQQA